MVAIQIERLQQDLNAIMAHASQLKLEGRTETAKKVERKGKYLEEYLTGISGNIN
jgi:hypothetical protein